MRNLCLLHQPNLQVAELIKSFKNKDFDKWYNSLTINSILD